MDWRLLFLRKGKRNAPPYVNALVRMVIAKFYVMCLLPQLKIKYIFKKSTYVFLNDTIFKNHCTTEW